jgi:hypothetical protein
MSIFERGKKYNVSSIEVQKFLEEQDFKCAICREELKQGAHFDHDHDLGFVRGLLCPKCNMAIGLLGDNAGNCMNAADYLLKFSDWSL